MKTIIVTAVILFFSIALRAQTVRGKVLRAGSDTVVTDAVVYYSGSMNGGTITDKDGRFELAAKSRQIPIIVSCVGYVSATVNYQPGHELVVHLTPKLEGLHEVVVRADGMSRKDEVAMFIREFIGTSTYAQSCTITNIDDINFHYDKKEGVLTAYCDKPIIIENKKLAYTIIYYLDEFSRTYNDVHYAGNFIFKEYPVAPTAEQEKIIANREDAYTGSRMQFVRALWQGKLDKAGFSLYDQAAANGFYNQHARYSSVSSGITLSERDILARDSMQNLYIHLSGTVYIYHKSDMRKVNTLKSAEAYSYINQNGFYGAGIQWAGPMGAQRIGDLLPFEYQPPDEGKNKPQPKPKADSVAKALAASKPKNKKLTGAEKDEQLLKSIVLTKDNPITKLAAVRKWDQPINYKIYGSTGDTSIDKQVAEQVKNLFNTIVKPTGLKIAVAAPDSSVNFFIFLSGDPDQYTNVLPADVKGYFKENKDSPGYYTYGDDGFHEMIKFVHLETIANPARKLYVVQNRLKQHILNGLGFFGTIGSYKGSVFNDDTGLSPGADDKAFDDYVIKSLYQPAVKSGMTEQELDVVLKNVK